MAEPFGPIRPEDAVNGWKLRGDAAGWWLSKLLNDGSEATIKGTTATTCAWRASWRESSEQSVDEARNRADAWIRGCGLLCTAPADSVDCP